MTEVETAAGEAVGADATVTLRAVTSENLYEILHLRVGESQRQFVADNAGSLAEAHFNRCAWYRAIYAAETPVGFVMLYDDAQQPEYFLWRLMVDERYQRCGFGRRAMELLIDYVRERPNAEYLEVSYHPGEGSPQPFYERLGFVETGRVLGGENVMRLELGGRTRPAAPAPRPLAHVVLFKLKDPAPETVAKTVSALRGLEGKVPVLRQIEVGADVLHSGRSYDVALITRFDSLADMQAYQVHPEHVKVLDYMLTVMAGSVAVDFELE